MIRDEPAVNTEMVSDLSFQPPDREPDQLEGLKVLVLGLGRHGGGTGLVQFLAKRGAEVSISDPASRETLGRSLDMVQPWVKGPTHIGEPHHPDHLDRCDWVVVNPAIPPGTPILEQIASRDILPVTELGLALCWLPTRQLALVTGTHGKSTTCQLASQMLKESGLTAVAGGNLGGSLLSHLDDEDLEQLRLVVEVSSFQAQRLALRQDTAAVVMITNLTEDHLDWHGSRQAYHQAKLRLLDCTSGPDSLTILPDHGPFQQVTSNQARMVIRCCADGTEQHSRSVGDQLEIRTRDEKTLTIPYRPTAALEGPTGLANALQSATLAAALGATEDGIATAIRQYGGLPHRYQQVGEYQQVQFIDDSKATTPEAVASALGRSPSPVHWLCGGKPKSDPIDASALQSPLQQRQCHVYCFGAHASLWQDALSSLVTTPIEGHAKLEDAVSSAVSRAHPGETVLLSPGGTSFDHFDSAEDRGMHFQELIRQYFNTAAS
ncbi:MAG: UDP-N-acetylmuramoyl-L-alanine--D-glutamate ligase [Planctomycetes bacterium]|jgi:UDP-N-acetylmuramoylalanine--D-glutamate ligase|nr:UDP-N-acetylmuramoyl-L-alanine--D-glutamate ligase [Planctomycetota bacterium]